MHLPCHFDAATFSEVRLAIGIPGHKNTSSICWKFLVNFRAPNAETVLFVSFFTHSWHRHQFAVQPPNSFVNGRLEHHPGDWQARVLQQEGRQVLAWLQQNNISKRSRGPAGDQVRSRCFKRLWLLRLPHKEERTRALATAPATQEGSAQLNSWQEGRFHCQRREHTRRLLSHRALKPASETPCGRLADTTCQATLGGPFLSPQRYRSFLRSEAYQSAPSSLSSRNQILRSLTVLHNRDHVLAHYAKISDLEVWPLSKSCHNPCQRGSGCVRVSQKCQESVSSQSAPQECQLRASYKIVKKGCQVRVPYKMSNTSFLPRVSRKHVKSECPTRVSSKSVLQKCQENMSSQSVLQECQVRVCYKSVKRTCQVRVSYKSAK